MQDNSAKGRFRNVSLRDDVKREIERMIIRGDYAPGSRTPSIQQVAELHDVGITTAQQALDELCSEGTLWKEKNTGTYVKPFIRDRLITAHCGILKQKLEVVAAYGADLGIDKVNLLQMLSEAYDALLETRLLADT